MTRFQLTVACGLALLAFAKLPLGGELLFGDVLCAIILPFAILRPRQLSVNLWFFPLALLVIVYALLLDHFFGTTDENMMRAFARNTTLAINLIAAGFVAYRWPRETPFLLVSLGVSLVVFSILQPSDLAADAPWKVGIGQGCFQILIGGGLLLIKWGLKARNNTLIFATYGLAVLFAYAGLVNDARSTLLIGLAGASMGILFSMVRRVNVFALAGLILALVMLLPFYFNIYLALAQSGALGQAAADRMDYSLNTYETGNALLAARYNTFEAMRAAWDAFPIGLGSFPPRVSYHSNIVTAIAETGIVGLVFWLNLIGSLAVRLWRNTKYIPGAFFGIYVMLLIAFSQIVVFEPMQGYNRMLMPTYFALLSSYLALVGGGVIGARPRQAAADEAFQPGGTRRSRAARAAAAGARVRRPHAPLHGRTTP